MISFSIEEPNIFVLLNFANDLINDTAPEALHVSGFKVHLSPVVSYNVTKVVKNKEMTLNGARFSVVLKRVYSNHVLHTYIPSLMLCIASTCSLFVPSDLIPGRMGLCITTFLSIISLFNGAKYVLYSDCIHYISTVCFFQIFLAEYILHESDRFVDTLLLLGRFLFSNGILHRVIPDEMG